MPAKWPQFLQRCEPLQAPDVIAGHVDVLPSERRQVRHAFRRDRSAFVSQHLDSFLQINGVPQDDGGYGKVEPAGLVLEILTKAVSNSATAVEENGASKRVSCFSLVEADCCPLTEIGALYPLQREQRALDPPQLPQRLSEPVLPRIEKPACPKSATP